MQNDAWRKLLRRFIAYDVPDDMAACFDCDEARCPDERFATCGERLARATAEKARPDESRQ
jgi:hypothetical protein